MITILYHARSTEPVCERLARALTVEHAVAPDDVPISSPKVLLRWGAWGAPWGAVRGQRGEIVINTPDAVVLARDKNRSRATLHGLCPKTWTKIEDVRYPCVIRPKRHYAGNRFYVCDTVHKAGKAIIKCRRGWYASELIDKASEYRVFVLHGYVVAVSQRFPASSEAIAWNLARGGRLINCDRGGWPIEACKASIEAAKRLGLDFSAVDVCVDHAGRAYVLEANTAPGLRNKFTIGQIAKALSWTHEHGVPPAPKSEKYLKHPALKG